MFLVKNNLKFICIYKIDLKHIKVSRTTGETDKFTTIMRNGIKSLLVVDTSRKQRHSEQIYGYLAGGNIGGTGRLGLTHICY